MIKGEFKKNREEDERMKRQELRKGKEEDERESEE
jgi:hypothetical protein